MTDAARLSPQAEQALGVPGPTAAPTTPRPSDGRGDGGEGPRLVIEGAAAQRIVRLIQMHRVAGQLDPADADAVRDVVQRQAGLVVIESTR
ncbi:MAG: hypothetical protein KJ042_05670 [Deltaproteobacteria bacterium]|nr:hypothetical protein [Deltaproteobacteria bacterium]